MVNFIEDLDNVETLFIGEDEPQEVKLTDGEKEYLSESYSAALGKPAEDIAMGMDSGFLPVFKSDATLRAKELRFSNFTQKVADDVAAGAEPAQVVNQITTFQSEADAAEFFAPDIASLMSENDGFTQAEVIAADRMTAMQRMANTRYEQAGTGFWAGVGYFIDTAVTSGPQNLLGAVTGEDNETFEGANQLRALAKEAAGLLYADVTQDEFNTRFNEILDRVADAGLLSETNPIYLSTFMDMVAEAGVGVTSKTETLFQMVDIATSVAGPVIQLARRTGQVGRDIAQTNSVRKGVGTTVKRGDAGADSDIVSEGTSPSAIAPGRGSPHVFAGPELAAAREMEANNTVLNILKRQRWGALVPEAEVAARAEKIKDNVRSLIRVKNAEIDWSFEQGPTGNVHATVFLGKRNGDGFKHTNKRGAEKLAERIGGAEVIEQVRGGKKVWVVAKQFDTKISGFADPTDIDEVRSGAIASVMSTVVRSTQKLNAALKRGELSGVRVVKEIDRAFSSALRGASRVEVDEVNKLFEKLRDDPIYSGYTSALNEQEFKDLYFKLYNKKPTSKATALFKSMRDINDLEYYITADRLLKDAIENDIQMVGVSDQFYRGRRVTPDSEAMIYFPEDDTFVRYADLKEGKNLVYELDGFVGKDTTGKPIRYVSGESLPTRRLYHTDVLGYNAGGHRVYDERLGFYIKQEGVEINYADGGRRVSDPRTFMAVRTEKEARAASDAINMKMDLLRSGKLTDEIVQANNDWNLSLESVTDFEDFLREQGIDLDGKVDFAADGEDLYHSATGFKQDAGSYFSSSMYSSRKRGESPLIGYGGDVLDTVDPLKATARSASAAISRQADQRYMFMATNGWLKAAKTQIQNPDELVGLTPLEAIRKAKISDKTDLGRKLNTERNTILYRADNTTEFDRAVQRRIDAMMDYVYDKDSSKLLSKGLDHLAKVDYPGFLRAMAFHLKLGLFSIDQFYVQGMQSINIAALSRVSPVTTLRSMSAYTPLRIALIRNLSDANAWKLARAQAPVSGFSAEEFMAIRDWVRQTGRNIVDRTAVEENNIHRRIGSKLDKSLEYGQVFFNEGELLARLNAALVSMAEYRKAVGSLDGIFEDGAIDRLILRQDKLTASMTASSAAPWQRSAAAVPLQFTTFTMRMIEAVFTDAHFSKQERARLALMQTLAYGGAGVPLVGMGMDRLAYNEDMDPNGDVFNAVRYGALDFVLSEVLQTETALGSRLGIGDGLNQLLVDLGNEGLFETLGGPGGQVTMDVAGALKAMVNNIFSDGFDYVTYDWNRLARNASSYNKAYAIYTYAKYEAYYSRKSEEPMLTNMTQPEALAKALGVPLKEEGLLWSSMANMLFDQRMLDKDIKEMTRLQNLAAQAIRDNDFETASNLMADIGANLNLLPPTQRDKAIEKLGYTMDLPEVVIRKLLQEGKMNIPLALEDR